LASTTPPSGTLTLWKVQSQTTATPDKCHGRLCPPLNRNPHPNTNPDTNSNPNTNPSIDPSPTLDEEVGANVRG